MRKIIIALIATSAVAGHAQNDSIPDLNEVIHTIPYVFEARIDKVEAYVGDEFGKPISKSKADWISGYGKFTNPNSSRAMAYTSATITVCRQYKGELPEKFVVISKQPYVNLFLEAGTRGDTNWAWIEVPPDDAPYGVALMPSITYPVYRLYFASEVTRYPYVEGGYTVTMYLDIPVLSENRKELAEMLSDLNTLRANPPCNCDEIRKPEKKGKWRWRKNRKQR